MKAEPSGLVVTASVACSILSRVETTLFRLNFLAIAIAPRLPDLARLRTPLAAGAKIRAVDRGRALNMSRPLPVASIFIEAPVAPKPPVIMLVHMWLLALKSLENASRKSLSARPLLVRPPREAARPKRASWTSATSDLAASVALRCCFRTHRTLSSR